MRNYVRPSKGDRSLSNSKGLTRMMTVENQPLIPHFAFRTPHFALRLAFPPCASLHF